MTFEFGQRVAFARDGIERVARVEIVVAREGEGRTVRFIRARFGDHVHLRPSVASVLRLIDARSCALRSPVQPRNILPINPPGFENFTSKLKRERLGQQVAVNSQLPTINCF
jgi:hypothetical protein